MYFRVLSTFAVTVLMFAACKPTEAPVVQASPPPESSQAADNPEDLMEPQGLRQRIATLSSDEFGGRAPMSDGERLTLDYLETQFRAMGLDPMFDDSYRQPVPLVSIEGTGDRTLSISDPEGQVIHVYADGPESVVWTTRVVDETGLRDSELVWAGYGIVAPEYGWDDYEGLDVTGKTVIVLVNDPGYASQDPDLFNGNAMTWYGRWPYKYEEAARHGAAGLLVVHETEAAGNGWEPVENTLKGVQFHLAPENRNMDRVKVEGWLQHFVAEEILASAGLDLAALEAQASRGAVKPIPLGLTASVSIQNKITFAESFNVGAVRRGTDEADELFIYMAHWDHLGTAPHEEGAEGDFIYNGALDNASGTAGLLEVAEAWANTPEAPRRTVGFLAVTAEESGSLGSRSYVADPPYPMNRTVGGINMDVLNFVGRMSDVVVVGYGASQMEEILADVARNEGRTLIPEARPEIGLFYRSDHFNFAKKGVPVLYAGGGAVDRERGADYVKERSAEIGRPYHTPSDELRDDWDFDAAIEDLRLFYEVGHRIAFGDEWPQWYEGNEFRAIREKSLSGEAGD